MHAEQAVGRYRASWPYLAFPSAIAVIMIAAHLVHVLRHPATSDDYVVFGIFAVLILVVWTMPATVISTAGFRRAVRFRLTPWQDVMTVFPAGPGDPDLLIGLRNGKKVSLVGVRQNRRAGVQWLVNQDRHRTVTG